MRNKLSDSGIGRTTGTTAWRPDGNGGPMEGKLQSRRDGVGGKMG